MDAKEFEAALAKALGVCRAAADLDLPIEEMVEHVEEEYDAALKAAGVPYLDEALLEGEPSADILRALSLSGLREILAAVGEVAAIGEKLPAAPAEPDFPMPANLRGTA